MVRVKRGSIILLAAMLVFLSACSSNSTNNENMDKQEGDKKIQTGVSADPFGKYDEAITIRVGQEVDPADTSLAAGDTPSDNQYTRYIQDQLNIQTQFAFSASAANFNQKVSLAIASNDLPDAMVVGPVELMQMYKNGQLADLTDAFNQYASPAMKDILEGSNKRALDSVTFDGKIMALPQAEDAGIHVMWIRKDWLDKLKLDLPQTVEDLGKIAQAFVEQDPDGNGAADTIGIVGPSSSGKMYANFLESANNLYGFDGVFSAFNSYPGYWVNDADGNAAYGSILPETKAALSKLREWYANGFIDHEMAIRKDSGELIISGKAGIFFAPWWMGYGPLSDAIKNDPNANWQAYALPLDGNGIFSPHLSAPASKFVVVRNGYEHPEAIIKMENLLLRDESKFDLSKGAIGFYPIRIPFGPSDESEFTVQALREVLAGSKKPEEFSDKTAYKLLQSDLINISKIKLEPFDNMDIQYWNPEADRGAWSRLYSLMVGIAPNVDAKMNRVSSLNYTQTKTMEKKWSNLKKMEDETFLKIVMGAAPLEAFDQFVKDWKAEGGDEITKEVAGIAS